ncbi:MAG: type III pantothenate kinase [Clostridia bacterium]|nr:type III pantothenate kinase [Clostridia bacterium]
MLLAIDIGNTHISIGAFLDDELCCVVRLSTDTNKTEDEYASGILSALSLRGIERKEVSGAIISSVVPALNTVMKKAMRLMFYIEPMFVAPGIKTGINIKCDNPSSVGSDIICAAVAAHHIYGSPALIVDMGTATKMIVVDSRGSFIGVSIMPGIMMGLQALSNGTAQLPQVGLDAPPSVIGKNTVDCMKSGAVFGNASMIDGMIDRFAEEYKTELPVYATGGLAPAIIEHCKHKITLDTDMVLKGLKIIYNKNI